MITGNGINTVTVNGKVLSCPPQSTIYLFSCVPQAQYINSLAIKFVTDFVLPAKIRLN